MSFTIELKYMRHVKNLIIYSKYISTENIFYFIFVSVIKYQFSSFLQYD